MGNLATPPSANAPNVGIRSGPGHAAGATPPATEVDAEGFQVVHKRGWKKNRTDQIGGDGGENGTRRANAADSGTAQPEDHGCGEDDAAGDEPGAAPSPSDLHQAWQGEIALVKRLRQQGIDDAHPAMLAACHARDTAERQWREAKDPTPPDAPPFQGSGET